MGKLEDYMKSIEGQTDLDASKIMNDLYSLHTEEIGIREAKIEELNSTVAERDIAISGLNDDITRQKAKNYDLAMQLPGTDINKKREEEQQEEIDGETITYDDLFGEG